MEPVHTVYGGAHLFKAKTPTRLGELALDAMRTYDFASLEKDPEVLRRVRRKLELEPVEDYRIDFEDGFGVRPDAEEDEHAQRAGAEAAFALANDLLPRGFGIRIKPLAGTTRRRAERTLELFLSQLVKRTGSTPEGFVVTLPKVRSPREIRNLVELLERHERHMGLRSGRLQLEIMVETPECLYTSDGRLHLPMMADAAAGRLVAAHFGTYDYTAALGITSGHQSGRHQACTFARNVMLVSLAGRGIRVVDGPTTTLPVPIHRGDALVPAQLEENRHAVREGWRLHYRQIVQSMAEGFYQSWDLHPAQLPARFAAVFGYYVAERPAMTARLRNFVERAARATRVATQFDDNATAEGLLNFFRRGVSCGALTRSELELTGVTHDELTKPFPQIIAARAAEERT